MLSKHLLFSTPPSKSKGHCVILYEKYYYSLLQLSDDVFDLDIFRYVNMGEMSSPGESLSPNRLNQALISETLSEFSQFEFVSANNPQQPENVTEKVTSTCTNIYETIKKGIDFLTIYILIFFIILNYSILHRAFSRVDRGV